MFIGNNIVVSADAQIFSDNLNKSIFEIYDKAGELSKKISHTIHFTTMIKNGEIIYSALIEYQEDD